MTDASKGLSKALARSASGAVVALAEMSTEDLIAGLSDDQRSGLAAALAPTAQPVASNAADHGEPDKMEPDDDEDDQNCEGKKKPACDEDGAKAASERIKAVAAAVESDPACKGKASLALSMLADDDYAGLSASGLVKLLGKPASGTGSYEDGEAGARAEMKQALAATSNSAIDAVTTTKQGAGAEANVWDQAAKINNLAQPTG